MRRAIRLTKQCKTLLPPRVTTSPALHWGAVVAWPKDMTCIKSVSWMRILKTWLNRRFKSYRDKAQSKSRNSSVSHHALWNIQATPPPPHQACFSDKTALKSRSPGPYIEGSDGVSPFMSYFIVLTKKRRWREPAEIALCSAGPHLTARRTQMSQYLTMNASRWPNAYSGAPPIWLGSTGARSWPSRPSSSTKWWRLALHATHSSSRGPKRWPRSLWLKEDPTTKNSSGALSSTLTKPSNNFNH